MKKFFTLIAAALLGMSANAQLATGEYYLQNVESGLYMGGANSWGTQASVTEEGDLSYVAPVEGGYTITGTTLTSANKTLGYNLYVDTNTSQNGNVWTIAPVAGEEGVYTLYGKGKFDTNKEFEGYVAQSAKKGDVTGFILEGVAEVTDAAKWRFVTKEERFLNIKAGDNVSFLFQNPGFTRNHATSAWIVDAGCTNKNLAGGANNNFCAESYHSIFNIHQTVNVPNGIYTVTAQGFYRQDGEDNENLAVFYANDKTSAFPLKTGAENNMSDASNSFTQGLYTIDPIEVEVTNGELTIGVKNEVNPNLWCIWDNFQIVAKQLAEEAEYTVYAKVTAGEDGTKTFVGQNLKVSKLGGVATVTLPAATAGGYAMESQDVKVNISAEGEITMIEGQTLNFTAGATKILVTVTGVEGSLVDGKVKVFVTAKGDNGKDVNVIYSTDEIVPDPEITILTKEMFKTWTSAGADAVPAASQSSTWCDYVMNASTGMPYGNGNVDWMQYADLSEYDYLTVTASAGTPRFFLNRKTADGQAPDNAIDTNNATHFANYVTKVDNGDGTFAFTLNVAKIVEEQGFAHLNVIKGGNWANVTVTKMELVKNPTAVKAAKAAPAKAAKVAKFFKNGKVVIVKDGKMFNVAGAQM